MAANNYFGFTHGGTQYAATGAAAYQPTQTGYAVPTAAAAATYTTQRAAPTAYETAYQAAATHTTPGTYAVPTGTTAAATTYDYGYAARTAQTAYDTSKTYYQQPTAAAAAAAAATYSTTDYQAAPKPSYSATYTTQTTRPATQAAQKTSTYSTTYPTQQTQASNSYSSVYTSPVAQQQPQTQAKVVKKTYIPQQTTSVNTSVSTATFGGQAAAAAYNAQNTVAVTNNYSQSYTTPVSAPTPTVQAKPKAVATTTYSGYDAALYSAATMYVAQQAQPNTAVTTVQTTAQKTTTNTWQGYKKPGIGAGAGGMMKAIRQKLQPKPQQLHYCDVCKISCAGPQTYREHLEGQKHKKKEASVKAGSGPTLPRGGNALHCELCDVTCTGADAYAAHIRGAKHQKVVKLHTKLGKPIPSSDPKAVGTKTSSTTSTSTTTKSVGVTTTTVAGGAAGTTIKTEQGTDTATGTADTVKEETKVEDVEMVPENEITPVGLEYIEEITNEEGKAITFNCKLCECRFNDPNAKEMHMKGRRHRLQFKKKVNPELVVDVKVTMRQKKIQEEKMRRQAMREEYFRRREEERANFWTDRMMEVEERIYWEERRRYEEELEYYEWCRRHHNVPHPRGMPIPPPLPGHPYGPPVGPPLMPPPPPSNFFAPGPPQTVVRRPDTSDDRHVISRHAAIYPKESELQAVQKIVSHTEKALKFVSDHLTDSNFNKPAPGAIKPGPQQQTPGNKPGPVANKPGVIPPGGNKPPVTPPIKPGGAATPINKPAGTPANKPPTTAPVVKQTPPPTTNSTTTTGAKPGQPQPVVIKKEVVTPPKNNEPPKKEDGRDGSLFSFQREKEESGAGRILKGVMRVGVLAKGLLLSGDTAVSLVVLCAEKPTKSLLQKVYNNLPIQLKNVAPDEGYTVAMKPEDAAILVTGSSEPKITVTVTLTSPVVRESMIAETSGDGVGIVAPVAKDPPDVLNKQKCLDALAALRHAKWFQARATGLQSCVMVIRILRDLCQRNPTWTPLNSWAMELLAEKVLSSAGGPMPPGDALRRIMEALASGILLPGGPGLLDPCEKDPTDAAAGLTHQQREDITASAQHALRLMAFRQIHKVLGMEMLPAPKFNRSHHRFGRKRRRDNSSGEGNDSEAGDGKKDKKDGDAVVRMETDKSSK